MIRYKEWMLRQDKAFIKEICQVHRIPETFYDDGSSDITLDELKALDAKFITNVPVGQEN